METPRFVFIAGLHKSGTSLLFRCLRAHPQVSGFRHTGVPEDEGQHLQSVYPPARAFGGWGKFGFDRRSQLTETSPQATSESRQRLLAAWGPYWDASKPVLLEKSPPNLLRARFLQALFPEAAFVVLLRHPLAVGYATQKGSQTSIGSLIRHWLVCHERFRRDRSQLRRVLVLKYENFVIHPENCLSKIYNFLNLTAIVPAEAIVSHLNQAYFERWRQMEEQCGDRWHRRYLQARYQKRVRRFGYSLLATELERF